MVNLKFKGSCVNGKSNLFCGEISLYCWKYPKSSADLDLRNHLHALSSQKLANICLFKNPALIFIFSSFSFFIICDTHGTTLNDSLHLYNLLLQPLKGSSALNILLNLGFVAWNFYYIRQACLLEIIYIYIHTHPHPHRSKLFSSLSGSTCSLKWEVWILIYQMVNSQVQFL